MPSNNVARVARAVDRDKRRGISMPERRLRQATVTAVSFTNMTATIALGDDPNTAIVCKFLHTYVPRPADVVWVEENNRTLIIIGKLGALSVPAVRVRKTTDTAAPVAAGQVNVPFTSTTFDTDVQHDEVTNNHRLTCVVPGLYRISASVLGDLNASGSVILRLIHSVGTTEIDGDERLNNGTHWTHLKVNTTYRLLAGEYVYLTFQALTVDNTIKAQRGMPHFEMEWKGY